MSILQDLDPQYAKIHAQPSTPRKLIFAAGVTLLVLAGGYWGVLQTRATPAPPNPAPVADSTPSSANLAVEPKQPATTLAATIREETQRIPGAEQRTTMPQVVQENVAGSLADAEYRRQTQVLPVHAKTTPSPAPAKPEHRNVAPQPTAKSGKSQASPGKRTNERDIDIITAIVR